ncbi:Lysine--tRNA ligase, mitochondrial [Nakaseomyces glabratus]|uniref:Lysine--tRNA ligase n=1 Tax=Candida glabrata TaxID=5478 RepID=A0A0W0E6B9_CANGB|nr:Lysine--tRNA ligase, mitochondrial [Nakaseomyces glabratus]KTB08930.1 Lysine--tRNA ligase, mitochondrial [Nakaseomyces glabratus]KTB10442.1 Lysine--tRNA ligase, mitochondrial [Nakaseomyces glabratus]KTB19700.1 Lysine--tRNA ligase, mitochondrial [Nakaseomyces glabratus]
MLRIVGARLLYASSRIRIGRGLASKVAIDSSNLEFTKRNELVLSSLDMYYPSMSSIERGNLVSIDIFLKKYGSTSEDQLNKINQKISLCGRIKSIRFSGKKMAFIDLVDGIHGIQLILNCREIGNSATFESELSFLRKGDYVMTTGLPRLSKSRMKNISLRCTDLPKILSVAQMPLPPKLIDTVKSNSNKVVDYQINGFQNIRIRSSILKSIRNFLEERDFIEVETPILSSKSNGAVAKPFMSSSKDFDKLMLRVAPELWLKRLIISGCNKVFEIGKSFRNEGIDGSHNPEFTTLEFYQSYLTMEDLIKLNEDLFKKIITDLTNNLTIKQYLPESLLELEDILKSNNWKFKRVEFLPTLSKELGVDLSQVKIEDSKQLLEVIPQKYKGQFFGKSSSYSSSQILNRLCTELIEEKYCNSSHPTIIYHHPAVISPLAKSNPDDSRTTKRFELFIKGREYSNAYEEENCPQVQLEKFEQQARMKEDYGDNDTLSSIDQEYINAMKWGMPPIGGFGLGIDRLCMLITGCQRIEQVLPFGTLDDVNRQ